MLILASWAWPSSQMNSLQCPKQIFVSIVTTCDWLNGHNITQTVMSYSYLL